VKKATIFFFNFIFFAFFFTIFIAANISIYFHLQKSSRTKKKKLKFNECKFLENFSYLFLFWERFYEDLKMKKTTFFEFFHDVFL
jgi:hypothetical protein